MQLLSKREDERANPLTDLHLKMRGAIASLSAMPQFVPVKEVNSASSMSMTGLLNVLNGCLVSEDDREGCLRLTWQVRSYETPAHSFRLRDEVSIDKFVAAMKIQADQTGYPNIGKSMQLPPIPGSGQ